MANENLRSKHAFGNLENVQAAIDNNLVDAHDILFIDGEKDPKVGWVDKNGNFRLVKNQDVIVVTGDTLPEFGEAEVLYVFQKSIYYWDGTSFASLSSEGLSESAVDSKVSAAVIEANAYTDTKFESIGSNVVTEAVVESKAYTDEKIVEVLKGTEIVEF